MTKDYTVPTIDEYLRDRLMPVEGVIPHISGIEMYGNSIPAGTVGGDLFEYINFQQRYDIDARIQRALRLSKEFLEPLPSGAPLRNSVDDHMEWLKATPGYSPEMETEYREARSSEQIRVAEDLQELYTTAGVLLVDAQGHGIISAKIASTVHDTFHALMLSELDRYGKTTLELFENINLRLAQSVTARNALGISEEENAREIATMLYGEVHPRGHFRFVNFGGLQIPADHPDRNKYYSMKLRQRQLNSSDIAEITLMSPGDMLVLYTDGVYDSSDEQVREQLEAVLREHYKQTARDICNALLDYAVKRDDHLRQNGDEALIDDKTVFIIKRS